MREIKFRVWNGKKFLTSSYGREDKDYISIRIDGGILAKYGRSNYHDKLIIQQYTGLKDKNGKEIYEGDIVSIYLPDLNILKKDTSSVLYPIIKGDIVNNVLIGEVSSDFGEGIISQFSYYINGYLPFSRLKSLTSVNNIEVIGNIFENPELVSK